MIKTLIAIKSCAAHRHRDDLVRRTWLSGRAVDYRFLIGGWGQDRYQSSHRHDEMLLDCPDDYASLPFKTQALCRCLLAEGYDFVFLCDNDTYVCVPRLFGSDFYAADYTGFFARCVSCESDADGHCTCVTGEGQRLYSYASGGSGYWLSRKAMAVVVAADFTKDPLRPNSPEPSTRGEDLQVGWALGRAGIRCRRDPRYSLYWPGPRMDNSTITLHNTTQFSESENLAVIHRAWLS